MDSLDAQCLIIKLLEREISPPDLWHHGRSGELSCAYSEGERTFTWRPDAVAEMAGRWRESATREVPEEARPFIDAHRRLDDMVAGAGRAPADVIVHDFDLHEVRARWEDQGLVVVIDEIAQPAAPDDAAAA